MSGEKLDRSCEVTVNKFVIALEFFSEQKEERKKESAQRVSDVLDTTCNRLVMGIPEGEERDKGAEKKIFEAIMDENFSIFVEIKPKQTIIINVYPEEAQ